MREIRLMLGDCLAQMKTMESNSVDSIVTDPPYGLSFMGKKWDYDVPSVEIWEECLRVLKPGGYLLAFAGTRTQHRMAVRIEDAGFEIRDMIAWVYGSGFPKSLNVSKAIDDSLGAQRQVIGKRKHPTLKDSSKLEEAAAASHGKNLWSREWDITEPNTDEAKKWEGWGTSLKPSLEPITVARKPLVGNVAQNVLQYGTGALNIDESRIPTTDKLGGGAEKADNVGKIHEGWQRPWMKDEVLASKHAAKVRAQVEKSEALGRYPANFIHDGSDEVVGLFPQSNGSGPTRILKRNAKSDRNGWGMNTVASNQVELRDGGTGSAARFFYCAKANKTDKGLDNDHPTVKPTDLMRYLCRLVTPKGGTVLDPFMGSGSTGKAAKIEGFSFIGIEKESEYFDLAKKRIESQETFATLENLIDE